MLVEKAWSILILVLMAIYDVHFPVLTEPAANFTPLVDEASQLELIKTLRPVPIPHGPPPETESTSFKPAADAVIKKLESTLTKSAHIFEPDGVQRPGWALSAKTHDEIVFVTAWGNYTFPVYEVWRGGRYVQRTFWGEIYNVTIRYGVYAPYVEPVILDSYVVHFDNSSIEYEMVYPGFSVIVNWRFYPGPPKSTAKVVNPPESFRVFKEFIGVPPDEQLRFAEGKSAKYTWNQGGKSYMTIDFSDEGGAYLKHDVERLLALFDWNDDFVDPFAFVTTPSTVNVSYSSSEQTLITVPTNLPAGTYLILFTIASGSSPYGDTTITLRIRRGTTILAESQVPHGTTVIYAPTLIAVYSSVFENQTYTITIQRTAGSATSDTFHIQAMVVSLYGPVYSTVQSITVGGNGASGTVTLNTNSPANIRMAVLATATILSTSSTNVYINANNLRLRVGNTVVMTNDIGGLTISTSIAIAVIFGHVIESSSANMAFHFDIINNTSQSASATVRIFAFRITTGGVADSPTITPQANVWNVVGSLFRNAGNPEVAIGILFGGGGITASYNPNTLAFRVNGSTTNQITNLVNALYNGRLIFVFLRYDESNVRTYTVEAYGAPSTGYSLDAKIIAFSPGVVVRIHYQVASGGNPVMGHITMRYIINGATQRTIISTSPRIVFVDNNTWINVDFISTGSSSNERWAHQTGTNFTAFITRQSTFVLTYYNQLRMTLQAITVQPYTSPLTPSNHARVNITSFGIVSEIRVWDGSNNQTWVNRGGRVSWYRTSSASTATIRWVTPGAVTIENVQSPSVSVAYFYNQLFVTWRISTAPESTPLSSTNFVTALGRQFGGSLSLSPLYNGVDRSDWVDYNSTISVTRLSTMSNSTRRWTSYTPDYRVTSSGTFIFTFQEERLSRLVFWDAVGNRPLASLSLARIISPNSTIQSLNVFMNGSTTPSWLQVGTHTLEEVVWFGRSIKNGTASWSRFSVRFTVTNHIINVYHPRIWTNLAGSGVEVWVRSEATVTAAIWDAGRGLLLIRTQPVLGEMYIHYGPIGSPPKLLYIDGTLVSDRGFRVDTLNQIIELAIGGGTILLDFHGTTQQPPQSDIQMLVQQLYAALASLRGPYIVNFTQPTGPTIRVPVLDLSWLRSWAALIITWIDRVSPVPAVILVPFLLMVTATASVYSLMSRINSRKNGRRTEYVYIKETPQTSLARMLFMLVLGNMMGTISLYYLIPVLLGRQPAFNLDELRIVGIISAAVAVVSFLIVYSMFYTMRGGRRAQR